MKPKKIGRPKLAKNLVMGAVITIRMHPSERKELAEAVKAKGEKLSKWARGALLAAARADRVSNGGT